jgi:opacity protein-like surface antigen
MQKKLSTILLFSTLIAMPAEADKIQGLYLGVGIGSQINRYDLKILDSGQSYTAKAHKQSVVGELSAGYNWYFHDQWFLGGEAVINFASNDASISLGGDQLNAIHPITVKIKRDLAYGLAIKVGKTFDKTSVFVRLGAELSEFRVNAHNSSVTQPNGPNLARTLSNKKTQFAFVPGIGFEFKANDFLVVGLDVRTSIYKKQSLRTQNIIAGQPATDLRVKYKPRVDQAILSFKFPIK